eukprot:Skav223894  [mRNA]  locus=scaffold1226:783967:784515:+ [translate_table: standard]
MLRLKREPKVRLSRLRGNSHSSRPMLKLEPKVNDFSACGKCTPSMSKLPPRVRLSSLLGNTTPLRW